MLNSQGVGRLQFRPRCSIARLLFAIEHVVE
jgi:hypothetical protein